MKPIKSDIMNGILGYLKSYTDEIIEDFTKGKTNLETLRREFETINEIVSLIMNKNLIEYNNNVLISIMYSILSFYKENIQTQDDLNVFNETFKNFAFCEKGTRSSFIFLDIYIYRFLYYLFGILDFIYEEYYGKLNLSDTAQIIVNSLYDEKHRTLNKYTKKHINTFLGIFHQFDFYI